MNITWKNCFRIALTVFILYLCIFYWGGVSTFLGSLLAATTPIVIGLCIAYVLNLVMSFYEGFFEKLSNKNILKKGKRIICVIAAILSLLGLIALLLYLILPELISCITFLIQEIPKHIQRLLKTEWISVVVPENILVELKNIEWATIFGNAADYLSKGLGDAATVVFNAVTSVFSGTITAFIGIFFSVYILVQKEKLASQYKKITENYMPKKINRKISHFLHVLNGCFKNYIVGQCTEAIVLGILCTLGMLIFRFPYAAMIGTLIGFTALIPIVGAYIGAAVGAIMILTVSPIKALLFIVFIIILQFIEGNFIYPKVVGSSLGLPAIWVLVAITIGGTLFGVLGMLLGVPLVATVYTLIREDLNHREKLKQINE